MRRNPITLLNYCRIINDFLTNLFNYLTSICKMNKYYVGFVWITAWFIFCIPWFKIYKQGKIYGWEKARQKCKVLHLILLVAIVAMNRVKEVRPKMYVLPKRPNVSSIRKFEKKCLHLHIIVCSKLLLLLKSLEILEILETLLY